MTCYTRQRRRKGTQDGVTGHERDTISFLTLGTRYKTQIVYCIVS